MSKTLSRKEEAITLAKDYIFGRLQGFAYPVVPLDDDGNQLPYEAGCVSWVVCTSCRIVYASCDEKDENGDWIIEVEVLLTWVGEDDESEDEDEVSALYAVTVEDGQGNLECVDYERID